MTSRRRFCRKTTAYCENENVRTVQVPLRPLNANDPLKLYSLPVAASVIVFGSPAAHETAALNDAGEMNPATRIGLGWVFEPSLESKFPWGALTPEGMLKFPPLNEGDPCVSLQTVMSMSGLNAMLKVPE